MKKKFILLIIFATLITFFLACSPILEFARIHDYPKTIHYKDEEVKHDVTKKTVVIIADNKTTEIFDLIAPYYLFSATEKANVYIVSENKLPIYLFKGLFVLPHFSFKEFDELKIETDAIIIPNLSAMKPDEQNPKILNWINNNYKDTTSVLSICAGASTAAATGLFDNYPITTHASDFDDIKESYPNAQWVTNVSVTNTNNLYSTAGVSNAVEGSLMLISNMFGRETMLTVKEIVNYPHSEPKIEHQSRKLIFSKKLVILKKVLFGKNQNIGILLEDEIDEFKLASIIDSYNRTFPKSINSFTLSNKPVKSKYNLTLIPTQSFQEVNADEIHIINSNSNLSSTFNKLEETEIIFHNKNDKYTIEQCLTRIEKIHGLEFKEITKLLLDFN